MKDSVALRFRVRLVKLLDVVGVTALFALLWQFFYAPHVDNPFWFWGNVLMVALYFALYYLINHLYSGFLIHINDTVEIVYSQAMSAAIVNAILYVVTWLLAKHFPPVLPILGLCLVQLLWIVLWTHFAVRWYRRNFEAEKTFTISGGTQRIASLIEQKNLTGRFRIDRRMSLSECLADLSVLSEAEVVFVEEVPSHERNRILKYCMENGIKAYVMPGTGDAIMSGALKMHMLHLPLLLVERYNPTPEYLIGKRLFDIVLSAILLILLSPLFLLLAILIRRDGGTVFYRQTRLTKDGRRFQILKFRSMRMNAEDAEGAVLSSGEEDPRVTKTGRWMRRYRLDELPQLLNILRGDMSFVGPRPARPEIAEEIEEELPEFPLRLMAKAGLTGYAQVYGKYNSTPRDKLLMDLYYLAEPSMIADLRLMMATLKILFQKESTEGVAP